MDVGIFLRTCAEYYLNTKRSRDAIDAKNLRKFRKLVKYAYEHSAYYKNIITSHKIHMETCYPEDFPVLTKAELMEHYDDIVTDKRISKKKIMGFLSISKDPAQLFEDEFYVLHTSGSSGAVGYFVYSQKDWARSLAQNIKSPIVSLRKIKKKIAFYGAADGHYTGVSFVASIKNSMLKHIYQVLLLDMKIPLQSVVEQLNSYQPDIIISYPSSLKLLAEKKKKESLKIDPYLIELSGEVLNGPDRKFIEAVFPNTEIINVYSSTDHLLMGFEKGHFGGMYLFEDNLIFDIKDDHILVTNLFNYTLPLIRYRMDDVLIPKADSEKIYPHLLVEEIVGRMENAPVFMNKYGVEDFISHHTINEIYVYGLGKYQMVVKNKEYFVFRIIPQDNLLIKELEEIKLEVANKIKEILVKKEMDNVKFDIEVVDELGIDPGSGKFKLILQQD